MSDEDGPERVPEPEEAPAAFLLRRTRLLLWIMLATGVAFTVLELALAPELGPHTVVKCFGLTAMIGVMLGLDRPWGETRTAPLALVLVTGGYVMTGLSGALSPSHEYETSAILFVAAAVITATLLPWGGRNQVVSVAVACLVLTACVWWADRSFAVLTTDPAAAVLVGFAASVVIATEMATARSNAARHLERRRAAEAETRALNADLERRVLERTADLEQANRQLAGEIDDRRRIADALQESHQRLLDVVDNTPALVSLKDRDGRYLLANHAFEEALGRPRAQLLGSCDDDFLSREQALSQRAHDLRVLGSQAGHSFEEEIAGEEGPRSYFSIKFPLRRPGGAIYGVGTVSTDITRLRRAEEQARQRQDDLAHVQRLHLVNQMAATLAHEIHQPLCAIANYARGGAQRLHNGDISLAQLDPILDRIASEALRAGEILRGVRRMVGRQPVASAPVDIDGAIAEAVDAIRPQARRQGVDIHIVPSPAGAVILADKTQIEQVVVNLALNGIDAAAETAAAETPQRRPRVSIASRVLPDTVEITVTDSGAGVAPGAAPRLFTPFFSTKASGLGMGLAISRSIVQAHGGDLDLVPSSGGAAFRFTLPLA